MDLVVLMAFGSLLAPALGERPFTKRLAALRCSPFETDLCGHWCSSVASLFCSFGYVLSSSILNELMCLYNRISVWQGSVW